MATKPIVTISSPPAAAGNHQRTPAVSRYAAVSDYWALTKREVNFLIAVAELPDFPGTKLPCGARSQVNGEMG